MIGIVYVIASGLAALTVAALIWSAPTPYTWAAVGWLACAVVNEIEARR